MAKKSKANEKLEIALEALEFYRNGGHFFVDPHDGKRKKQLTDEGGKAAIALEQIEALGE